MKKNFKSHVWVTDDEGNGYVCKEKDISEDKINLDSLSEEEKTTCKEVSKSSGRHSLENLNNLKFDKW